MREAVGVFHDPDRMEDAVDSLLTHGFDYAEISVLAAEDALHGKLGEKIRSVRELEDDPAAPRRSFTMSSALGDAKGAAISSLLFLGAITATGAVALTGGALAAVIGAAVAGGGGGAAIGAALARLIDKRHARRIQEQIEAGGIVLWVNLRDAAHEERALQVLKDHGAEDVHVHDIPAMA